MKLNQDFQGFNLALALYFEGYFSPPLEPFQDEYELLVFRGKIPGSNDGHIGSHISVELAPEVNSAINALDSETEKSRIIESLVNSVGNKIKLTYDNTFVGKYAKPYKVTMSHFESAREAQHSAQAAAG